MTDTDFMIVELVGGAGDGRKFIAPPETLLFRMPRQISATHVGEIDNVGDYMVQMDTYKRGDDWCYHTALTMQLQDLEFRDFVLRSDRGATRFYLQRPSHV